MTTFDGKAVSDRIPPQARHSSFFFDFSTVMERCQSLKQNPERVALMCQAQVRQIAPGEAVIPAENGFHLVVRTRSGAAAGALASEINRALLRRLFGTGDSVAEMAPMFHAVNQGKVLPFTRSSLTTKLPEEEDRSNADLRLEAQAASRTGWTDFKPGFIPVFNLRRKAPPIHLCGPVSLRQGKALFGGDALRYCHPEYRPSVDIAMLKYGMTLLPEAVRGKNVSAIAASVSYETMAWSRSRQSYLDALRAAQLPGNAPLIIKLDDVPKGTPPRNLADIIAGLKPLVRRIFIHLPDRDTSLLTEGCLGAEAFCASVAPQMTAMEVAAVAHRLEHVTAAQRALSCILGAGDNASLRVLHEAGISLATRHPDRGGINLGAYGREMTASTGQRAA
jgi:hypothetical protein